MSQTEPLITRISPRGFFPPPETRWKTIEEEKAGTLCHLEMARVASSAIKGKWSRKRRARIEN
ncbi:UNVERIFIED_CONTAM: hypothetical protein K2H54_011139, partial [Gekko kuhli]